MREILGGRLAQLWMSPRSRHRTVTCVTCISDPDTLADCQSGELAVLALGDATEEAIVPFMEQSANSGPAALLVPAVLLADRTLRRLRDASAHGEVALGLLSEGTDPAAAAISLSRALASVHADHGLARLQSSETLRGVADTLGRLVGNSVTIETPNHEVLAHSPAGTDVDEDRVRTILMRRASAPIMGHPDFKHFLTLVRSSDWPVLFPAHPEFGHSGRIAMRIATEGELFGIIWVTHSARPLGESDYATIQQAASVAAVILARERLATRREAILRAELLEDVMQGRIADPENIRTVALSVGWNVDRLQQALVVAIDDFERFRISHAGSGGARLRRAQERLMELVKLEVQALDPDAVVGMRSSRIVVLFDSGEDGAAERRAAAMRTAVSLVHRTSSFLADMTVTAGVGRDFPSIEYMGESFRQAELAAELGQTLWGGNRALHYDDLGIHRVLYALREHEGMMTPALQRILAHDEEHGTDYVRTVAAYLRHMGRLRQAAAELGLHRNTLEYRLGRISELAQCDLDDPDHRLALELGIRLLELDGRLSPPLPGRQDA